MKLPTNPSLLESVCFAPAGPPSSDHWLPIGLSTRMLRPDLDLRQASALSPAAQLPRATGPNRMGGTVSAQSFVLVGTGPEPGRGRSLLTSQGAHHRRSCAPPGSHVWRIPSWTETGKLLLLLELSDSTCPAPTALPHSLTLCLETCLAGLGCIPLSSGAGHVHHHGKFRGHTSR